VRDQPGATTWKPLSGDYKVGSTDLWGRPTPCGPHSGCAFSRWLSCESSSRSPMYTCSWGGLDALVVPMDPCEVHVSHSNWSGLASLGLVPCLACIGYEPTALPWLRWRGMNHRRWVCYFFCTYFPATTRSPRTSGTTLLLTKMRVMLCIFLCVYTVIHINLLVSTPTTMDQTLICVFEFLIIY
jgi:hypothetical protein